MRMYSSQVHLLWADSRWSFPTTQACHIALPSCSVTFTSNGKSSFSLLALNHHLVQDPSLRNVNQVFCTTFLRPVVIYLSPFSIYALLYLPEVKWSGIPRINGSSYSISPWVSWTAPGMVWARRT